MHVKWEGGLVCCNLPNFTPTTKIDIVCINSCEVTSLFFLKVGKNPVWLMIKTCLTIKAQLNSVIKNPLFAKVNNIKHFVTISQKHVFVGTTWKDGRFQCGAITFWTATDQHCWRRYYFSLFLRCINLMVDRSPPTKPNLINVAPFVVSGLAKYSFAFF